MLNILHLHGKSLQDFPVKYLLKGLKNTLTEAILKLDKSR